jgi:hypothetical protein
MVDQTSEVNFYPLITISVSSDIPKTATVHKSLILVTRGIPRNSIDLHHILVRSKTEPVWN